MANYATWNPVDKSPDVTLAEGNLRVIVGVSGNTQNAMCTMALTSGKWYFEHIITTSSVQPTHAAAVGVVVGRPGDPNSFSPFAGSNVAMFYGGDGTLYRGGNQGNLISWPVGSVAQIALDVDNQKIWFGVNGTWYNSGDPAAGTNATVVSLGTGKYEFFTADGASAETHSARSNFGQFPWRYDPPTGFVALSTENLSEPTISNLAAEKPEDYFKVVTYTGSSSNPASVTGVGFQPDLVWVKTRSFGNTNHRLQDSVRGPNKRLMSDLTDAEIDAAGGIQSFDADGFTVGDGTSKDGFIHFGGRTFVAWCWKAAGTAVSNTDGGITSTVSANPTSGFSICTFTSTGSDTTVGHGLSSVPDWIWFIRRNTSGSDQLVYHSALGATKNMRFNNTDAVRTQDHFLNTEPTSSVFSVKGTTFSNGSDYVAYCWSEVDGFSSFGSYVGNGSADGPFVHTGFRPAFVLVKPTTNLDNWIIQDATRDDYNPSSKRLFPNLTNAEVDGPSSYSIDLLSNGFKPRVSHSSTNQSGEVYIYMAFADSPFKYSAAR